MKIVKYLAVMFIISICLTVVVATVYPEPFMGRANTVLVVGRNAALSDGAAATKIATNLASYLIVPKTTSEFVEIERVTEDEIGLGGTIISGKINPLLDDNDLSHMIDGKIRWDDGESTEDEYNVHEEITLKDMNIITSLDDEDLIDIAITNDQGISYRLVFEEDLDTSNIGDDDADPLYITILGIEYEVEDLDSDSITVSTSEEKLIRKGDTLIVGGASVIIDEIFDDYVQISGVLIEEDHSKKVNGITVRVDDVAFYPDDHNKSKAIVRYGNKISETYDSGDAYIGEDEDEPNWVWDINDAGLSGGYIGVTYDKEKTREKDELVYSGESYKLPNDFVEILFEGVTETTYGDFKLSFEGEKDLWNSTSSSAVQKDVPVLVIEGLGEDSLRIGAIETDTIYLYYADMNGGTEENNANGSIEIFYEDINRDVSDKVRPRYADKVDMDAVGFLAETDIAVIEYEDTEIVISIAVQNKTATLIFTDEVSEMFVELGGEELTNLLGTFEYFGSEKEDAEPLELSIDGVNIGTEEQKILTHYGVMIQSPDSTLEDDELQFSVPSERIYATVSVIGRDPTQILSNVTEEIGIPVVYDDETGSYSDMDMIVVGGSCINTVAAKLLGTSGCGEDFTSKTGVKNGQYLLETFDSPYSSDKIATLIAGYNAVDTTRGVNEFVASGLDTTVGNRVIK